MANRINIDLYDIHFELARFIHFFPMKNSTKEMLYIAMHKNCVQKDITVDEFLLSV